MVEMKLFNEFSVEGITIEDPGLKRVIDLTPKLLLKSHGRDRKEFAKVRVNIVERLMRIIQVPGSRGKKHRIITGWMTGKYSKSANIVIDAFKIIEKKTGKPAVQVFVKAIENASPREEVTAIEYGGARYPQPVDTSPVRRVNLALRFFVHGAYDKAFNKKANIVDSLAKEIMLAAENSPESYAVQKRADLERQADAAR